MDFHDSTLVRMSVEWASAWVVLELDTRDGPAEVHLEAVRESKVPRLQPWGPSGFVNSIEFLPDRVMVEMQSGDRLEFHAAAFHIRRAAPRWGDTVKLRDDSSVRPGELGSVCGLRERNREVLVLVEFSDGSSVEVLATSLELITES